MKTIFIASLLIINALSSWAFQSSNIVTVDNVFDSRIKTVQLYREGWNLSQPLIKFRSEEKLELHFDLLSDNPETYYYTFVHCDRNWKESSIFPSDYLEGIPEDQIENYKPSFNTRINYYHYKLTFPGEKLKIKLPGNYILKVFKFGENDRPVITRRFMVSEDIVRINASAHRPNMTTYFNTGHQVDITVNFESVRANDPYRDFSTTIVQNGKWTGAKMNLKPDFVGSNELKFNSLSEKNIFPAGNEFRYFDIKSIRYQSEFVRKIEFVGSAYHVFLYPSENREFKPYFYWQDFNGSYYVAVQEGRDMDTEADYVYVYFTLPSASKLPGGKMYVSGAFNYWNFDDQNIMTWDASKNQYQATLLLKQGWYNYEYIFISDKEKNTSPSAFEGNHYETSNEYLILVYYRNPVDRYDRLVGTAITSSNRN